MLQSRPTPRAQGHVYGGSRPLMLDEVPSAWPRTVNYVSLLACPVTVICITDATHWYTRYAHWAQLIDTARLVPWAEQSVDCYYLFVLVGWVFYTRESLRLILAFYHIAFFNFPVVFAFTSFWLNSLYVFTTLLHKKCFLTDLSTPFLPNLQLCILVLDFPLISKNLLASF